MEIIHTGRMIFNVSDIVEFGLILCVVSFRIQFNACAEV